MAMAIKKKNRTLALVEEEKSETTIRKQVGLLGGAFRRCIIDGSPCKYSKRITM